MQDDSKSNDLQNDAKDNTSFFTKTTFRFFKYTQKRFKATPTKQVQQSNETQRISYKHLLCNRTITSYGTFEIPPPETTPKF